MDIDCLCTGILFADLVCSPIDHVPEPGELVSPERMELSLGGCSSNTAFDLARLGFHPHVAGCVGDDTFGQFILQTLTEGGVEAGGIQRIAGVNSAATMIINVQGQDRRFISNPGANTRLTVEHIPADWVRRAKVIYIGGFGMLPGLETDEMVDLLRTARAAGTTTILDVVLGFGNRGFAPLARILPEVDIILPNDDEAALLTGLGDPLAQAERFREAGAKMVVITQGEQGSLLVAEGVRLRCGTYPTTFVGGAGSGDAFDAGFIAGWLLGEDPAGCLRWGSALGASCVRSISTTESIFHRDEAVEFIAEHTLPIETF